MPPANVQIFQTRSTSHSHRFRCPGSLPDFDEGLLSLHRADAHWRVVDEHQQPRARCSLWWQTTPTLAQGKAGIIGHYAAVDGEAATVLLENATRELAAQGCTFVLGPMDQNTWRDYRLPVSGNDDPSFFLEPPGQQVWSEQFAHNGFQQTARYFSAMVDDLNRHCPRLSTVRARIATHGIRLRPLDRENLESELRRIYAVAQAAFAEHLFYVQISEADFLEMYRPFQQSIPTDLVLVAEKSDRLVGFCFAVPDLLQAQRGEAVDTVVVKTFGVIPDRTFAGLGQVLLEEVQQRAATAGFRRGIHALVRDTPHMRRISARYAHPFRRYALFGKELCG